MIEFQTSPHSPEEHNPQHNEAAHSPLSADLIPASTPAMHRRMCSGLSLAGSVLRAEGVERASDSDERPVVVVHNFHNRVEQLPGNSPSRFRPLYIDPTPVDSLAISQLPMTTLAPGECAIIPQPIPGAIEYALSEGLVQPGQLIAVDPPTDLRALAHNDLLSMAAQLPRDDLSRIAGTTFVSAFTDLQLRRRARSLGVVPVQNSDSAFADDKRVFLRLAPTYGIKTCDSMDLETPSKSVIDAVSEFGGWLKLSKAMGGCGIIHIPKNSPKYVLPDALRRLQTEIAECYAMFDINSVFTTGVHSQVIAGLDSYFGVTLEVDVSAYGKKVLVGSSVVEIDRRAQHTTHAYFQQIVTQEGEFLGSSLLDVEEKFSASLLAELEDQARRIARMAVKDLGFAGIAGIDFMVLEDSQGNFDIRIIELNARPPISATSFILGSQKLGAEKWRAPYLVANSPIVSMAQLEQLLTIDGVNLTRTNPEQGRVTPLHFGTIGQGASNSYQLIRPAHWCQVLISGETDEVINRLIAKVQAGGDAYFGRPNW